MNIVNPRKLPNKLLDRDPLTCPDAAFDGYSEREMSDLVHTEWLVLKQGTRARNFVDCSRLVVAAALQNYGSLAEKLHTLDKGAERERGRLDVCRLSLQVIRWLRAVQAVAHKPLNFYPQLGELYRMQPRPLFKPAGPAFDLAAWLKSHEPELLDTSRVRIADGKLLIRGFDAADRAIFRSHERTIVAHVLSLFDPASPLIDVGFRHAAA
jgi:hypothetical protein